MYSDVRAKMIFYFLFMLLYLELFPQKNSHESRESKLFEYYH